MIGPSGESAITVQKNELLAALRKNLETHIEEYKMAMVGYRQAVISKLEANLAQARELKNVDHDLRLPIPASHEKDYRRVIRMLEMSVNDIIIITDSEFNSYVMDDWSWKGQFQASNAWYRVSSR